MKKLTAGIVLYCLLSFGTAIGGVYWASLAAGALKILLKVGWDANSLIYVQKSSISIFIVYSIVLLSGAALTRRLVGKLPYRILLVFNLAILTATLALLASGIIGVVP